MLPLRSNVVHHVISFGCCLYVLLTTIWLEIVRVVKNGELSLRQGFDIFNHYLLQCAILFCTSEFMDGLDLGV